MLEAMRDYAEEYLGDLELYQNSLNCAHHLPIFERSLRVKMRGMFECQLKFNRGPHTDLINFAKCYGFWDSEKFDLENTKRGAKCSKMERFCASASATNTGETSRAVAIF